MKFLHSIRAKIWLCVNVAFGGLLIATVFGLYSNNQVADQLTRLRDMRFPLAIHASELSNLLKRQVHEFEESYLFGQVEQVEQAMLTAEEMNVLFGKVLQVGNNCQDSKQDCRQILQLKGRFEEYLALAIPLFLRLSQGENPNDHLDEMARVGRLQQELLQAFEETSRAVIASVEGDLTRSKAAANRGTLFLLLLFAAVFVLTTILVNYVANRTLLRPLARLKSLIGAFRSPGFDLQAYPRRTSRDEIGDLHESFWRLIQDLQATTVSRAYLDNILQNLSDGLIVTDADCRIRLVNPALKEMTGFDLSELQRRTLDHLLEDYDPPRRQESADLARNVERNCRVVDGSSRPVLFSETAMRDADGHLQGLVYTLKDITERKRLEEALRFIAGETADADGEAFFLRLVRHLAVALQVRVAFISEITDPRKLLVRTLAFEAHGSVLDNFEYTLVGTPCEGVLEGGIRWYPQDLQRLFPGIPLMSALGAESYLGAPLRGRGGKLLGVLSVLDDKPMPDAGWMKSVLRVFALRAGAELERLAADRQLKEYAARLAASNRELEEFAYVASHDLQEPLRKVQAFGERLQTKCGERLDESGRDYLQRMQNAAGRMQNLINGLLTFSRVATKGNPFGPVDLAQVAREVAADLEVRIEEVGGRVVLGDLPTLTADPLQMRQLLQNLIGNALKFRRPGVSPEVRVHAEPLGEGSARGWRLLVEDNGIGIEEKYLERIFHVFQRLHGRDEYEGSGVGLAVCRKIAERHGGSITVRSVPGEGATFIVTLAEMREAAETSGVERAQAQGASA